MLRKMVWEREEGGPCTGHTGHRPEMETAHQTCKKIGCTYNGGSIWDLSYFILKSSGQGRGSLGHHLI